MPNISTFNEILEQIDNLSNEDQEALVDLIKKRLIERRRDRIADNIKKAHQEYELNDVTRGSVEDIISELNS